MLLAVGVGVGALALLAVGGWARANLTVAEPSFDTVRWKQARPTQLPRVARSMSTPWRRKISACLYSGR